MGLLLGIDLGTSSVKALLVDEEGRALAVRGAEYPILIPHPGFAEQDPAAWWRCTCKVVAQVIAEAGVRPAEIKGIGLSGQMHGMVPLDAGGELIGPAVIWPDQRSRREVEEIYRAVGRETFTAQTLNPLYPGFTLASLGWLRRHEPERYGRLATIILPKDFLRLRLTGTVGTDTSDASATLAFNTAEGRWSRPIIDCLRLPASLFPSCSDSTDVVGTVTTAAAAETGLAAGTPVVAGGSDQPMQAIGNGLTSPGSLSITIGTGGQLYSVSEKPLLNPRLNTHTFCNVMPRQWYVMAATLSAGLSLSWLRENILMDHSFASVAAEVEAAPPGSEGLLFLPYLAGERTPHLNPDARAVFFGLTLKHTRGHMTRAVMEGVGYSLRDCREILQSLGVTSDRLIGSGGGARSSQWLQIQADILGRPIHTTSSPEQASLGAAIVAGVGVGVYPDIPRGCEAVVRPSMRVTEPIEANVRLYEEGYQLYHELYHDTSRLFGKLNRIGEKGREDHEGDLSTVRSR
jgi:xylulokinase